MAIDNQFGKGIGLAAGFDLGAQKPLDSRIAVNTIAERDAHVTENRAYEGMLVFVDATKLTYQLVNGEWKEFGFNANDFNDNIAEDREAIQANADAIEAINHAENGILAQAKAHADAKDAELEILGAIPFDENLIKENLIKQFEQQLKNYQETEKYCLKALQIRTHEKTYINEFGEEITVIQRLEIASDNLKAPPSTDHILGTDEKGMDIKPFLMMRE